MNIDADGSVAATGLLMVVAVSVLAVLGAHGRSTSTDPEIGTWRLDPQKSSFYPGPAHRSQVRTVTQVGDTQFLKNETVTAEGFRLHISYEARFDGRPYPVAGTPMGDAVALRRINERTVEATIFKNGVVVATDVRVVSGDGTTLTVTQRGIGPGGQRIENVLVYRRQ